MAHEFWRKIVHIVVGGILIAVAVYIENYYSHSLVMTLLFIVLLLSLVVDFLIADIGLKLPIYHRVQRQKELTGFHGSTHLMLGIVVALQFYPFSIAIAAISMLVFGDALAALVGRKWGTPFYKKKSLIGSTVMFVTSIIAGFVFISSIPIVIAMALAATIVEIFITHVDDNLMIPVFAGLVGIGVMALG